MADCKKCIHSDICIFIEENPDCIQFQDRADVVEVVRCKDCKHYKAYEPPIEDFDGWCKVNENEYDKEFYCSYGERKEE